MKKDVIIIGAGPCGATAAIYAARAGLEVMVFDNGQSALLKADKIENYYGFESVSGKELYEKGIKQLESLGVERVCGQVLSVVWDGAFTVGTDAGKYTSDALLIATGAKREKPPVPAFDDYLGRGASYCAVCDGFFYKGRDVAVIGSGQYALSEARELAGFCRTVYILTNGQRQTADFSGFEVCSSKILGIEGDQSITGVALEDKIIPVSGIFAAVGVAGAVDFARHIGAAVKGSSILVNDRNETNIPGLYASGDCTEGIKQIGTAVGAGITAAMQMIKYVKSK